MSTSALPPWLLIQPPAAEASSHPSTKLSGLIAFVTTGNTRSYDGPAIPVTGNTSAQTLLDTLEQADDDSTVRWVDQHELHPAFFQALIDALQIWPSNLRFSLAYRIIDLAIDRYQRKPDAPFDKINETNRSSHNKKRRHGTCGGYCPF